MPQPGRVVISNPLLKRALSRRAKHELLFEHATLALGHEKSLKQQQQQKVCCHSPKIQLLLVVHVLVEVPEPLQSLLQTFADPLSPLDKAGHLMAATVACRHRPGTGASRFWMSFKALCLLSSCGVIKGYAQSPSQLLHFGLGLQKEHSLQGQEHPPLAIRLP